MPRLSAAAREVFDRNYALLEAIGVLPDLDLLGAYSVAVVEMEKAQEQIDRLGEVVNSGGKIDVSPYVGIRDRARETVERLGQRLGIDQARALAPDADEEHPESVALTVRRVHLALKAADGVKTRAAKLLGKSRGVLRLYMKAHPELEEAHLDIEEGLKDLADSKLVELMRAGNLGAIVWFQKTRARDRGYTQRDAPQAPGGEADPLDLTGLTDDELEHFHRLLAKAADARRGDGRTGEAEPSGDPAPLQKLPPVRH